MIPFYSQPPDVIMTVKAFYAEVDRVLAMLSAREADVLRRNFGLDDGRPMTWDQIADLLNICRSTVGVVKRRALGRLRHHRRSEKLRSLVYTFRQAQDDLN
jgi:RNA polymerase primary sigma factor